MLLILPISQKYHQDPTESDPIFRFIQDRFPGGISTLTYVATINTLSSFIDDSTIMLMEECELIDDNSLTEYTHTEASKLCVSELFINWMTDFYMNTKSEYSTYLQNVNLEECQHYKIHPTKLCIQI